MGGEHPTSIEIVEHRRAERIAHHANLEGLTAAQLAGLSDRECVAFLERAGLSFGTTNIRTMILAVDLLQAEEEAIVLLHERPKGTTTDGP